MARRSFHPHNLLQRDNRTNFRLFLGLSWALSLSAWPAWPQPAVDSGFTPVTEPGSRCEPLLLSTRHAYQGAGTGESFAALLSQHFTPEEMEDLSWQSQTSPRENSYWMELNQLMPDSRRIAFMFEVPVVKQMNDGILVGQKRLVNILLNYLKSTLKANLSQLLPPELNLHWYSDFKSLGLVVDEPEKGISERALRSLVMEATMSSLAKFEQLIGITSPHMGFYRSVNPHSWLKVGGGHTPQFASAAARLARYIPGQKEVGPPPVIWFHDEGQYHLTTHVLPELEVRRTLVIEFLSQNYPSLLTFTSETSVDGWRPLNIKTLHPEVFRSLRSATTLEEFHDLLLLKFPQLKGGLEDFVVRQIWNYFLLQDQLSPPVYFKDRTYANLSQSDVGGASLDFVGLGALNSMAVDIALSEYLAHPGQPSNLILQIQRREAQLTKYVHKQRENIAVSISNILRDLGAAPGEFDLSCSADDCALSFFVIGDTPPSQIFERSQLVIDPLLNKMNSDSTTDFRIVMIGSRDTPPLHKDTIVGHGESMEKKWRHRLYELGLTYEEQVSLQAIFVMRGSDAGFGAVDIHYVTQVPGDRALHNLLGQALREVLLLINDELGTRYEMGNLSSSQSLKFL